MVKVYDCFTRKRINDDSIQVNPLDKYEPIKTATLGNNTICYIRHIDGEENSHISEVWMPNQKELETERKERILSCC